MPAMEQRIESINQSVTHLYNTYESNTPGIRESDKPSKYPDLAVDSPCANNNRQFNLIELIKFMEKTAFPVESMRAARKRECIEGDVWLAFAAYCQAIEKVPYNYNNNNSLFDINLHFGQPNCKGRAKGFVQLLAVCGVPLGDLALVGIGGEGGEFEGKKIAARDEATVDRQNVRVLLNAPEASNSPNSVTVSLQNNELNVSRTTREPFAYHYCAMVRGRGKYKFYDPLFHRVYVNGMNDYFLTYAECKDLMKPNGPKCYVDSDDRKNRLYSFKPDQVSKTFANSNAVREVQAAKAHLDTGPSPSVYLIIDSKNWLDRGLRPAARGSRRGEMNPNQHPWIATQIFGELFPYD